jgi:glutathione S-transferase
VTNPVLIIANKNYSSWSLRAWLALAQAGIVFDEVRIALGMPDTREKLLGYSPAGKVPVLIDGSAKVWESIAICEYAAERWPEKRLWPADRAARAHARSVSAEMHAGFAALRAAMPMNCRSRYPGKGRSAAVDADIARIEALWGDCLKRYGGPFLFGAFSIADAMYAPVVSRFLTYDVKLVGALQQYAQAVLELPAMREWYAAGAAEPEFLAEDEPYATAV